MSGAPIKVEARSAFLDVLELARSDLRAIVKPIAGGRGELVAWCDAEGDEGLEEIERATACRRLQCSAVELVEAQIECPGDAGELGAPGGGVVNVKAWIPKQEG